MSSTTPAEDREASVEGLSEETNFEILRVCAWAGPIFIVCFGLFWGLIAGFVPPPGQFWSASEVASYVADNSGSIRIGMLGAAIISPLYFVWSTAISRLIRRIEGQNGILANVEMLGGVASAMVLTLSSIVWLTAAFRVGARSAEDIQLLWDLAWMLFNVTFGLTAVQLFAIGAALVLDRRADPLLPHWLGWFSFVVPTTFLPVLLLPFVMDGPFAWHGLLTYWVGLAVYFAWAVLACFYVLRAVTKLRRPAPLDQDLEPVR